MLIYNRNLHQKLQDMHLRAKDFHASYDYKTTDDLTARLTKFYPTDFIEDYEFLPKPIPVEKSLLAHPDFNSRAFLHIIRHGYLHFIDHAFWLELAPSASALGITRSAKLYHIATKSSGSAVSRAAISATLDLLSTHCARNDEGYYLLGSTTTGTGYLAITPSLFPLLLRSNCTHIIQMYSYLYSRRAFTSFNYIYCKSRTLMDAVGILSKTTLRSILDKGMSVGLWNVRVNKIYNGVDPHPYRIYEINLDIDNNISHDVSPYFPSLRDIYSSSVVKK